MAGLIRREDVDQVRERARIDEIVSAHVTLKPAGVGALVGLCPFHDERSPSFNVRPSVGRYHCFGCGEGGDVIEFVMKMDGLGFTEAIEYLAGKTGVQLRYEEGGTARPREEPGRRQRLLDAHSVAAEFYAEQLMGPDASAARTFLAERSFDRSDAELFGVGFAPKGWDALQRHLQGRGFTQAELVASGLMSQGQRGIYDRFRGRVMWPIRDVTGAVIGFGARRLFEDDQGPKYLNTPETSLYKKSHVLYGIDLAKREIAKGKRVVVVEGYTDVMAAHLSGVTTAVATCGTAFGADHAKVVRRLLGDTTAGGGMQLASGGTVGGEIIFTFDGDAAGQKAAERAYGEDQRFFAQTYVAVADDGMDPCDLRMARGPEAVRALVDGRKPLFAFVIQAKIKQFDLNTVEGRVSAVRAAAPEIVGIRDRSQRDGYMRQVAGWIGTEIDEVRREVARAASTPSQRRPADGARPASGATPVAGGAQGGGRPASGAVQLPAPDPRDPVARDERLALVAVLQYPQHVPASFDELGEDAFAVPAWRAVHGAIRAAGGAAGGRELSAAQWVAAVLEQSSESVAIVVTQLSVASLPEDREAAVAAFVEGVVRRGVGPGLQPQGENASNHPQPASPPPPPKPPPPPPQPPTIRKPLRRRRPPGST
ncbi:DNA primase [Promicromonospora sp. NPDC059942]|uniref:DNA primase n=1 Tax=Promicromonospora sp. NPDC059942 TaxID=3347009 RepID=UPI003657D509